MLGLCIVVSTTLEDDGQNDPDQKAECLHKALDCMGKLFHVALATTKMSATANKKPNSCFRERQKIGYKNKAWKTLSNLIMTLFTMIGS